MGAFIRRAFLPSCVYNGRPPTGLNPITYRDNTSFKTRYCCKLSFRRFAVERRVRRTRAREKGGPRRRRDTFDRVVVSTSLSPAAEVLTNCISGGRAPTDISQSGPAGCSISLRWETARDFPSGPSAEDGSQTNRCRPTSGGGRAIRVAVDGNGPVVRSTVRNQPTVAPEISHAHVRARPL